MSRPEGMPAYDPQDAADIRAICEHCGRAGHERHGYLGEPECHHCLPLRIRVGRKQAEWKLYFAMVKLGRLPSPWPKEKDESIRELLAEFAFSS